MVIKRIMLILSYSNLCLQLIRWLSCQVYKCFISCFLLLFFLHLSTLFRGLDVKLLYLVIKNRVVTTVLHICLDLQLQIKAIYYTFFVRMMQNTCIDFLIWILNMFICIVWHNVHSCNCPSTAHHFKHSKCSKMLNLFLLGQKCLHLTF